LTGDLDTSGGSPYSPEKPRLRAFPAHCTEDTVMDIEFRITHECGKNLRGYWLEVELGHTIYFGKFQNPLFLSQARRCTAWGEDLAISIFDTEKQLRWTWISYLDPGIDEKAHIQVKLLSKRRYPPGEGKVYFEYEVEAW
jgi:hypothetical protein